MSETENGGNWTAACDAAIIVALREELKSLDIFEDGSVERIDNDLELEIHKRTLSELGGGKLNVLTLLIDDQGPESAAIATTKFLLRLQTKLVILVGISGKISDDCKIGDVILASGCDNSLYRGKLKGGEVLPGGKEWHLNALAKPLFTAINASPPFYEYAGISEAIHRELQDKNLIRTSPTTHYGLICATPFLVDDPSFGDWLKHSRNRNILATDMESVGVVQAAHDCGVRNGRILVIRGVSDPADGTKSAIDTVGNGVFRRIAMRNASQLASHCISNLLTFATNPITVSRVLSANSEHHAGLASFKEALDVLGRISKLIEQASTETDVCKWAFNQRKNGSVGNRIAALAESAYKKEVLRTDDNHSPVLESLDQTSRDYLVASWIMDSLIDSVSQSEALLAMLSNVYPSRVNRFCKAMLMNLPDEKLLVDTLITAYNWRPKRRARGPQKERERAKAHICYLLGRVRTAQQRQRAAKEMNEWRRQLSTPSKGATSELVAYDLAKRFTHLDTPEKRLLLRTICISLILLERQGEAEIYVRACIRNRDFDSLNRGFHLEYYGDIDYDVRESMENLDKLGDCDKTFEELFPKLTASFANQRPYPLRDVELQTLLSLAQHRYANGVLKDEHRGRLVTLLETHPDSQLSSFNMLQAYCGMIREHIKVPNFKRSRLIRKLFELKKLPRSGWNDVDNRHTRTNPNPETVLSHTAGGLLLIQFFLPDRLTKDDRDEIGNEDANDYSKEIISRMFLCHDLAEAYTGDLTPRQRNDVTKLREKTFNSVIDLLCTYSGFYTFPMYREWADFDSQITINGKVAREIDVLENLLQLEIEHGEHDVTISDYKEWREDLINQINTPMAKRILKIILE